MHVAVLHDLVKAGSRHVAGHRKADSLTAAGLGQDEGVDSHHAALRVDQRASAVAGINRRIGLDVGHRIVRLQQARGGTDDAHAHRALKAQWISQREHQLPLTQLARIAQDQHWKAGFFDLDHRQVGFTIHADQFGGHRRFRQAPAAGIVQLYFNLHGVSDDVVVGENQTVLRKNHAGAGGKLLGNQAGGAGAFCLLRRGVGGGEDLHHRGPDPFNQRFKGGAQLTQRGGAPCLRERGRADKNQRKEQIVEAHLPSSWHRVLP